ncbi:hypothetical protein GO988_04590 [Hymenobacter sp. HMF4947]|uniref:Uncharacterized protein n=1 Tax=Hymenobacter ginkgonis TaxID=2682976 RepID=A0A7K1TB19_9BACT|nr:hypothetical protein [Hymenobacter ginkgonis]MVN75597.1 hypothetical protein [Hymenobacter ginkgonis]
MVYLVWSLLNIGLGLGLLYLVVRTVGLVRQQRGLGTAVLLSLGLLALCHRPSAADKPAGHAATLVPGPAAGLAPGNYWVSLDKQLAYHLQLEVSASQAAADTSLQVRATPVFSGLSGGQDWHWLPGVYQVQGQQLSYDIPALLEWKILGLTLYTQFRQYHGRAALR